jgi:hypothetical protein
MAHGFKNVLCLEEKLQWRNTVIKLEQNDQFKLMAVRSIPHHLANTQLGLPSADATISTFPVQPPVSRPISPRQAARHRSPSASGKPAQNHNSRRDQFNQAHQEVVPNHFLNLVPHPA